MVDADEEVIRIGPNYKSGWKHAMGLGLLDCEEPPIKMKLAVPRVFEKIKAIPIATESPKKYYQYRARATPKWLTPAHRAEILALYKCSRGTNNPRKRRRRIHQEYLSVDHIVPLAGENVCGLHVPWNLRLINFRDNQKKGVKYEG
jgi:hypothetical protein